MAQETTITVLGGGNGAFAAAADLALKGCRVRLLEAPEFAARTIAPIQERGGIDLVNSGVEAIAPSGFAPLDLITDDPAQALQGSDIVLYVVPAFAEQRFTELCLPHFRPEQLVVFFCGNFGGALEFASLLRKNGRPLPTLAETEGLVYGAFKQDATTVKVGGYKQRLAFAALPSWKTEAVFERLRPFFPDFSLTVNVLETGLRNVNPIVHAPVSLANAGRTAPDKPKWRYYWEGVTEPVGEMVMAVDRERLSVARAFNLRLPNILEVLLSWYGNQGAAGGTLAQTVSTNPAYEIAWAPQSLDHRFLTEDVPYGLVCIEALAKSCGVETPLISAHITLVSQLLGVDFRQTGRSLARLGLEGMSVEQIRHVVQ
ncbi:MAG: NAD/NADP octopine/nopaline dehydrogenase family protein [Anaerolineae bacterium]|nr:NAD/NADP octopine/nopaline dehydrogenase family protein [Anaerolineae bacterium]